MKSKSTSLSSDPNLWEKTKTQLKKVGSFAKKFWNKSGLFGKFLISLSMLWTVCVVIIALGMTGGTAIIIGNIASGMIVGSCMVALSSFIGQAVDEQMESYDEWKSKRREREHIQEAELVT